MSSSAAPPVLPYAKVAEPVFLGLLWAGCATSLLFVLVRVFIRIHSFRVIYADDFLVIAAWGMFLATAILWSIEAPTLYLQYGIQSGRIPLTSPLDELNFVKKDTSFLRTIVPFNWLYYTSLWTVKLSFLMFFRRLGSRVRGQQIWWWVVLVIVVATWIACVADIQYNCALSSYEWIIENCAALKEVHYGNRTFYANCVADVVSDILIISIPVLLLWNVRIPPRQKLILMAIFSVTVVVMVFSIVRVAVVANSKKNVDISWLYLWSNIEVTVAIIIACVASFRQLFTQSQQQGPSKGYTSSGGSGRRGFLAQLRSWGWTSRATGTGNSSQKKWTHLRGPSKEQNSSERPPSGDSHEHIVPLDGIHVSQNFNVHNDSAASIDQNPAMLSHTYVTKDGRGGWTGRDGRLH
ncbi:MAG: hypothetical protein M1821_007553 [Bathelium mastoideum]|nr:MAG: hypothetical protein M1821_007553 [Bathelium mastoideum]KAI9695056.1 MAG: hypothetical protein M1822_000673 [Bathelium mastoideum]